MVKLNLDKSTICCINQKERTQKHFTWHPYTLINVNATNAFGVILNWLPCNCQNKKITISHNINRMKGTLVSKYYFNWTVYSIVWNIISLSLCPMPPVHGVEERTGRYFRLSNLHLFNSSITLLTGVFDFAMAAIVPPFPLVTKIVVLFLKNIACLLNML